MALKKKSNPNRLEHMKASWNRGKVKKAKRVAENLALHKEKVANKGLGRRERRRIESGVNHP
jgi:hypothetical protein